MFNERKDKLTVSMTQSHRQTKKIEPVCWWAVISFHKTQWKFSVQFLCHFFTFGNWRVVKKLCRPSSVETLKLYVYPYFLFYSTFILFQNFMDKCLVIVRMCVCVCRTDHIQVRTQFGVHSGLHHPPVQCWRSSRLCSLCLQSTQTECGCKPNLERKGLPVL